jgi:hypothetical protein
MRQRQRTIQEPRTFDTAERARAQEVYLHAYAKVTFPVLLLLGSITAYRFANHLPPYEKFFLPDDYFKLIYPIPVACLIGHYYGRWVCRRQGVSLERQEHVVWRRKPQASTEAIRSFGIGEQYPVSRVAGALGTLLFVGILAGLVWMSFRLGILPQSGQSLVRYLLSVLVTLVILAGVAGLGLAGLLMSLAALRSGGELVRVDEQEIVWFRGGVRHRILWTKLARAEVTRGFDVKGELKKLELRFFDGEDEPQGVLAFGENRPGSLAPSYTPWSNELADFATELEQIFDTRC